MSYLAIVTFDLTHPEMSPHGVNVYRKITSQLEGLDFYKAKHGRKASPFELPSNTYAVSFDDDEFDESKELAEQISRNLRLIFENLQVRGKFFVSVGKNWAWKGGGVN
ncbi:hypothetical protein [Ralstonia solanacearum]|uniref:hypothetical protein n=1 Tax=Ralstonia solanacearum TaxID=305 RepID=UPI000F609CC3|nr:hypothetical protein [Ralstonia solanacearum]